MERNIIILAENDSECIWFLYHDEKEMDEEFAREQKNDPKLKAVAKIVISKSAKLEWYCR